MARTSKSRFIKVAAHTLRIHPLAQRQLVPSKLRRLMAEMDLDAIGVLHAVEYEIDGVICIWIIDGQHRWRALTDLGLGEWIVEVKVHMDVTDSARASELFLKLNDRALVSAFDKFDNEVKAAFPAALGIVAILRERGVELSRSSSDGKILCVTALKNLFNIDQGETLELTLDTVLGAWGRTASAVEGKLLEGIGLIYHVYDGSVDQAMLTKKLSKYPGGASAVLGDAKGLRGHRKAALSRCVAQTIIEAYNTGRRKGKLDAL